MESKTRHQVLPIESIVLNEGQIEGLPKNPRWIRDSEFERLKKSIEEAPELLDARMLLVYPLGDEKYITIGGNMRLRACKELGYKELPCYIFPKETPVDKLREYTIKDNVQKGQWDYEMLANEWDLDELQEWGMETDYLSASGNVDFDSVDNVSEDNYDAPKIKMLECPHCHHQDMAIHFKSFEGNTNGNNSESDSEEAGE